MKKWDYNFDSAVGNGHSKCVKNFIEDLTDLSDEEEKRKSLNQRAILAAKCGQTDILRLLLGGGADINDDYGFFLRTPLAAAAFKGHTATADFLLKNGACVNKPAKPSDRPLKWAVLFGYTDIAEMLLKNGAEVDNSDPTALEIAAENGYHKICEFLLEAGSNVNHESRTLRTTPLTLAAENKHPDTVRLLIQFGADIDHIDSEGFCALQNLYQWLTTHRDKNKHFLCLKILLLSDADVRMKRNALLPRAIIVADGNEDIAHNHIPLLYAAGSTITPKIMDNIDEHRAVIPQFVLDDQEVMLPLAGLCRRQIRSHLLDPDGGNQKNLITAIPKLPLPQPIKDFLIFDVDI